MASALFPGAATTFVENRALDVHALGAQADLASVFKARARQRIDGYLEVAISKHHGGVLAAHLNDTGRTPSAAAFMMARAGARLASGEGDAVHAGVPGENSPAEPGPKPCTTLYTPLGMPAWFLAQQRGGGGGFLRWA